MDAEWQQGLTQPSSSSPLVSLFQLACQLNPTNSNLPLKTELVVFLVDLQTIDVVPIGLILNQVFASPTVVKLGFCFKQDLVYLENTFRYLGWDSVFPEIKCLIDISSLYHRLHQIPSGNMKGLAAIYQELLGDPLEKEEQCSEWSNRPLTDEQTKYATLDVISLVELADDFQDKFNKGASRVPSPEYAVLGLSVSEFVHQHGETLSLKEKDKIPKNKRKGKKETPVGKGKQVESCVDSQVPLQWDLTSAEDGRARFLVDVNKSLGISLRRYGIDAEFSSSRSELIDQARTEKRIILTTDVKLLRQYKHLIPHHIYGVNIAKDQLEEVIQKFDLRIPWDQVVPRCSKCNRIFVKTTFREATKAFEGIQNIPDFLEHRKSRELQSLRQVCLRIHGAKIKILRVQILTWNVGDREMMMVVLRGDLK